MHGWERGSAGDFSGTRKRHRCGSDDDRLGPLSWKTTHETRSERCDELTVGFPGKVLVKSEANVSVRLSKKIKFHINLS